MRGKQPASSVHASTQSSRNLKPESRKSTQSSELVTQHKRAVTSENRFTRRLTTNFLLLDPYASPLQLRVRAVLASRAFFKIGCLGHLRLIIY